MTQPFRLQRIYEAVARKRDSLSCVIGFDAFIDHILRPIRARRAAGPEYFEDLRQFAESLLAKGNMSGTVELTPLATKYGGNNPLLSCALGRAGIRVDSIGAYGGDHIRSAFSPLAKSCRLHNFAEPGECYAYEFNQNKIMTFTNMRAEDFTYRQIEERIGGGCLRELIGSSDMLALVNYSEQPAVLRIWNGLLEEQLPHVPYGKKFFFDLADCAQLPGRSLLDCFEAVERFRAFGPTYLSLNDNEFIKLCSLFLPEASAEAVHADMEGHVRLLREKLPVDCLILRTLRRFYAVDGETAAADNIVEPNPKCLTGAGDNQNAGICLGLLCGLPLADCLLLGVRFGNYYINQGQCGALENICQINLEIK